MGAGNSERLLEQARELLQAGERRQALSSSICALEVALDPEARAQALHQIAVIVDDHPLPTHDEVAWRAAAAAYREQPDVSLYRVEAVRRHIFRSPFVQIFRSVGNLLLYLGLILCQPARSLPVLWVLCGPLSLPVLLPGVIAHLLARILTAAVAFCVGGRVARSLRSRPEDMSLLGDLQGFSV